MIKNVMASADRTWMKTANITERGAALNDIPSQVVVVSPAKGLFDLQLREVWRYRELLYFLIWRELKIRYKQAAIGVGWAIIQPVVAMLIFTAVFGWFARIPSDGKPYALFAYSALLPWTYFAEALRRGSTGLVDDAELVRKIYFPRLIIPLAMVIAPLADLLLAFLPLLLLFLWYDTAPSANIVFLPLFLLLAAGMALAMGLWLGPINVKYRDVKHAMPFLIQVWMYASPIVYPVSLVPPDWRVLYSLNPTVGLIEGFRWAVLGTQSPDFVAIALSVGLVAGLLAAGLIYFKRNERFFADVI